MNRPFSHCLFIILLGLAAYSNTFHVPFHFDDTRIITKNPVVKDLDTLLSPSKTTWSARRNVYRGRYVGDLTFALNYKLHGLNVTGYHIFNLAIHIINGLLVYFLVILTFGTPQMRPPGPDGPRTGALPALFAAFLFVAHPVQTQAVTYITQRFASLATMLYLLSLILYIKARTGREKDGAGSRVFTPESIPFYLLSIISAVLAMKTKEIAFTLPVVITVYEFIFFDGWIRRRMLYLPPLLLTMLIIPLSLVGMDKSLGELIGDVSGATRVQTEMSRCDYLLTQCRVVMTYIRLLFLPVNQNLDYDYPIYHSFFDIHVLLPCLLLLVTLSLALYLFYRSRIKNRGSRIITFGILWFVITLSVESGIIPIVDVIFEHRVYLPAVGVFAAITSSVLPSETGRRNRRSRTGNAVGAIFLLIVIALSVSAYTRNGIWRDEVTLWMDVVRKSPNMARGHHGLGNAYKKKGLTGKAIEHFRHALTLNPYYTEVHVSIGFVYFSKGLFDAAIKHFRTAVSLKPNDPKAHLNLGIAYKAKGMRNKANEHFRKARMLNPALFTGGRHYKH